MPLSTELQVIHVLARRSPLSQVQVTEIEKELHQHFPMLCCQALWIDTPGDRDQETSIRPLERTDFFTKDIDEALLQGQGRVAVHSAKDLPDPLAEGLYLAALTEGVDASDSLVLPAGRSLESLPTGAKIGTSSERREDSVRLLRDDVSFVDIRGNIGQRLAMMDRGELHGVVVAEAALIRLGLTQRNRITLPGPTVPGQGQLAVVVRENDQEMIDLFALLDTRSNDG